MWHVIDRISDQDWRFAVGRRVEALSNEVFQVVRWALVVGFADYMSRANGAVILWLAYWALAGLLFAYLASRFLLRPEIRLVPDPTQRWQRVLQSMLNFLICVGAFALVLWALSEISVAMLHYRAGRAG